jgi:hypothetical protein
MQLSAGCIWTDYSSQVSADDDFPLWKVVRLAFRIVTIPNARQASSSVKRSQECQDA